ncbi:kinesin heavy chain [Coprinopsis cinerea AmutBmut pab1-1]|nr:kinesin heavy chain [Coprinopsis cinerea AmutBmut pab1-1]
MTPSVRRTHTTEYLLTIASPRLSLQLVDQNSALKEADIAERKLLARNERIQNLEAPL